MSQAKGRGRSEWWLGRDEVGRLTEGSSAEKAREEHDEGRRDEVRILYIVPLVVPSEDVALRRQQIPDGFLEPGTEVEFRVVRFSGSLADSYYDDFLIEAGVLEAGISAEEEGFDAVCMDTVSDAALLPLRSRLSIPVVGPGLTAFHVASLLGSRFGIVASWPAWGHFYVKNLRLYGLEQKLVSIRYANLRPSSDTFVGSAAESNVRAVVAAGRRLVDEDGADVVVIGSTSMAPTVPALAEALNVPVINPGPWACKLAEALVKIGISHSKRAFASPEVNHDAILKSFADATAGAGASV